jgi:excisionase family DNA binding protein
MNDSERKPVQPVTAARTHFEPLLDSDEAAALLKIHPKTLQRMARNGQIAAIQIGKLWRFRASQLNQWMESKVAG